MSHILSHLTDQPMDLWHRSLIEAAQSKAAELLLSRPIDRLSVEPGRTCSDRLGLTAIAVPASARAPLGDEDRLVVLLAAEFGWKMFQGTFRGGKKPLEVVTKHVYPHLPAAMDAPPDVQSYLLALLQRSAKLLSGHQHELWALADGLRRERSLDAKRVERCRLAMAYDPHQQIGRAALVAEMSRSG